MSEYVGSRKVVGTGHRGIELTADILTDEEVIRCRDCAFHLSDGITSLCDRFRCSYYDVDRGEDVVERYVVSPDGFCAWAERREGGTR